jgi:hypothetical protein
MLHTVVRHNLWRFHRFGVTGRCIATLWSGIAPPNRVSRAFAHGALYAGARSTLQTLAHMLERGEIAELRRGIEREGRQIGVIQGYAPGKRH